MRIIDRARFVMGQIVSQRCWIKRCGGDEEGYVRRYGDPEPIGCLPYTPPTDKNGRFATVSVPLGKAHLLDGVAVVADYPPISPLSTRFYKLPFGNGGKLIYQADKQRLIELEHEFDQLRAHRACRYDNVILEFV